jgi:hypothetical protein
MTTVRRRTGFPVATTTFPLAAVQLIANLCAAMWRIFLASLFLTLFGAGAQAHPLLQNSMWVVFAPDRARVAVNVSVKEILVARNLSLDPESPQTREELEAAAKQNSAYIASHLTISVNGQSLPGRVVAVNPPPLLGGDAEKTLFQYELDYPWTGVAPGQVTFRHEMLKEFPYAAGQPWDVSYVMRLKRSDRDEVSTGLLRSGTSQEFATGWGETKTAAPRVPFGEYLHHGVMHILTGYDHLLFVSALVLVTMSFWEMFKVIAAFTLAHTITLAVSTLTGFALPDIVVEPIIAGSIVVVALQNVFAPKRSRGWLRLAVAFGFGLVHGLGFAGGLRDSMGDLGLQAMIIALIAFSIGVEIGHQVVVLPLFGLLKLGDWKLTPAFRSGVLRYGSIMISIAGGYYFVNALRSA